MAMLRHRPATYRKLLISAFLLTGCAGQTPEMRRASVVGAQAVDCGPGSFPEATLTKEDPRARQYDVGCDFSLVKVTCSDDAGCALARPDGRDRL